MKKLSFLILFVLISLIIIHSGDREKLMKNYQLSIKAYQNKNYSDYLKYTKKSLEYSANNLTLQYNLAGAYSLNNKLQKSYKLLYNLLKKGFITDFREDDDFKNLQEFDKYNILENLLEKNLEPTNNYEIAFEIPEKDLIPEGIAYNPITNTFYISSMYKSKIISYENEKIKNFKNEEEDNLSSVIGMKVDKKRQDLIAVSSYGIYNRNQRINQDRFGFSALFIYNLKTGDLKNKFELPIKEAHFLNDLTIADNGDIYITDSHHPSVYILENNSKALVKYVDLSNYNFPNGITISPDQKYIFVATSGNILRINLKNKKIDEIKHDKNILINSCDGLYFYKNSLIGVQSFLKRISEFNLNKSFDKITKYRKIEANNPHFNYPTTGVISNDNLYLIANSQLNSYTRRRKLFPKSKLEKIKILKIPLK